MAANWALAIDCDTSKKRLRATGISLDILSEKGLKQWQALYQYEEDLILYRGLSVSPRQLDDPLKLLDLDNPHHNTLNSSQRFDKINQIFEKNDDGALGLWEHQVRMGRSDSKHGRVGLSASEDVSQTLSGEIYAKTYFHPKDGIKIGVFAQIQPEAGIDPILLSRKVYPHFDYHEASLLNTPDDSSVSWYFNPSSNYTVKDIYKIIDMKAFQRETKKWEKWANLPPASRQEKIYEAASVLAKKGILKLDPVLPALNRSNWLAHSIGLDYVAGFSSLTHWDKEALEMAFKQIHDRLDKIIETHHKQLASYASDARVKQHYRRVKERVLHFWGFLKDKVEPGSKAQQQYLEMIKKLNLIESYSRNH